MRRILHHVHNHQNNGFKWTLAWWICCWVPMMAVAFPLLGHYEFPPSFNVKPFCYPGTTNHQRLIGLAHSSSSLATTTTTQLSLSSSSSSASQSPLWSPNNTDNNNNATMSTIQGKTKNNAPNNTAAEVTAKNQTQSTNKMNASNITTNPPTATTANNNNIKIIEGIGGKGGVVYDVNRLKRNLLQETMTAYKEELFELLTSTTTSTSNSAVVEKLGALVQASPVRTTTDSNLLDGQDNDWVLAFRSRYPTTVASLVLYNDDDFNSNNPQFNARYNFLWNEDAGMSSLLMSSTKNNNKKKKNLANKNKLKDLITTRKRTFRLEELDDEEDAYIMDTTYLLGGLLTRMEWFDIVGLTRSSLQLIPTLTQWSVLGRQQQQHHHHNTDNSAADKKQQQQQQQQQPKNNRSTNKSYQRKPFSVQIIYLDNDLCILTEDNGPDSPFMVYTRNSAYVSAYQSMRRKFKILRTGAASAVAWPFRQWQKFRPNAAADAESDDPILKEIIQNNPQKAASAAKKLRVLRLGNVRPDDEDESWESETDPFVHLSADERQRLLKAMSVQEVEEAAETYRNARNRFQFLRRFLRKFRRNKRSFKAPPQAWQRPAKKRTNNNKSKKKK